MPTLSVDDIAIRYRVEEPRQPRGAPPWLLLHMAGASSLAWAPVARLLGRERQTLVPDLPGHGQSAGGPLDSITAMAQFALRFLDALMIPSAFVVGHSMGGAVALAMALQSPLRVRGLGLVATGARLPVSPAVLDLVEHRFEQAATLFRVAPTPASTVRREPVFPQTSQLGVLRDFRACVDFNVEPRFGELHLPSVVIVGRNDVMTPVRWSERLAKGLDGQLTVVEGAGHLLPREQPQVVATALSALLTRAG